MKHRIGVVAIVGLLALGAAPAAAQTDPDQPAADQYQTPGPVAGSGENPTAASSNQVAPATAQANGQATTPGGQAPDAGAGQGPDQATGQGPDEAAGAGPQEGAGAPVSVARPDEAGAVEGLPFTGGWPLLIALVGLFLLLAGALVEVGRRARERRRASLT